jgi:hypothetical protein
VVHWLQKGAGYRGTDPITALDTLREMAQQGAPFCQNDGCEVVGRGLHSSTFQLNLSRF